jgi:GNAT superfamily N-acetyltransferase
MQSHLSDAVRGLLHDHRVNCRAKARQIRNAHTSEEAYRQTLVLETIDHPSDARLKEFYRLYEAIFTLADERESFEGFEKVLGFNEDATIQRDFGPLREIIFALRDPNDGTYVGAANFALYAYPGAQYHFPFDASCQLNFLLVREDLRGVGIATELLRMAEATTAEFGEQHCGSSRAFMTCEQNNPIKMTAEQTAADAAAALIDPLDRMAWWRRRGFRRLEMPYVQPPLDASLEACTYLDYYVRFQGDLGIMPETIPSSVLLEHLRRFFTVSVAKFAVDIQQDASWRSMASFLAKQSQIAITPRSPG